VRDGLPPLVAEPGQQTTAQMPRDTGETRTAPTAVAPGSGPGPAAGSRARRALLPLLALLLGVVLLGGLAWALSSGLLNESPSGAGGAERVEVPRVVGLSLEEARGRLGDAGLELGSRKEAVSNEVAAGAVVEQNPPAGNQAERGTAVDVVVSTGPPAFELTTQSPSTATSSASSTASSSATAPASTPPVGGEDAQEAAEEAEEAAEEAEEAAEEEAKEREKAQKESEKQAKEKKPPPGGGGKNGKGKGN
jgi:hypothetical protein